MQSVAARRAAYQLWAWVSVGGFAATCLLLYSFVLHALVGQLQKEVRQTRAMLLLVPLDVAHKVPEIKRFIREQARQV